MQPSELAVSGKAPYETLHWPVYDFDDVRLVGRKEGIEEGSVVTFCVIIKHSEQNCVPLHEVLLALDDFHLLVM